MGRGRSRSRSRSRRRKRRRRRRRRSSRNEEVVQNVIKSTKYVRNKYN